MTATSAREIGGALSAAHDRLAAAVEPMTASDLTSPSYCRDWSVAQVLSHLGSGAEIFGLLLESGLAGTDPPGREEMAPIWEAWNAKSPEEQAQSSRRVGAAFLERFAAMTDDELQALRMTFVGRDIDAVGLLTMRLAELALHTWDVTVMRDPGAVIAPDAVDRLMDDQIARVAGWSGKPGGLEYAVEIVTVDPARTFALSVSDSVRLTPESSEAGAHAAHITLPGEALVRLMYGRLDPAHTPATVSTRGIDLDMLRATFPGI